MREKHVPFKRLLRSQAGSTVGSFAVRKQTCSYDNTAAFARCEHSWISLRAQRNMFRRKECCVLMPEAQLVLFSFARRPVHATPLHSHAVMLWSTLGSLAVRNETFSGERLLRSHAGSTVGSLSVHKKTCSCDNTAALPCCEHTWISLRAQRGMFHQKDCCVLTPTAHLDLFRTQRDMFRRKDRCFLTPGAQLDFFLCAKEHVPAKRRLRSRAAPQDRWVLLVDARSSFYSQARAHPLRYREPVTRNPSHRAFVVQIVGPISVYAVGE